MTNKQQLEQDDQHFNWTELDFKQDPYFSDVNVQIQLWILLNVCCLAGILFLSKSLGDELIVIKKAKWKKSDKKDQKLFVLLHGLNGNPDNLYSIYETILEEFKDSTILVPELPTGLFSIAKPEIIARDLVFIIDKFYKKYQFKDIYLIGHSLGSLIARKVYLYAYGEVKDEKNGTIKAPFDNIDHLDELAV